MYDIYYAILCTHSTRPFKVSRLRAPPAWASARSRARHSTARHGSNSGGLGGRRRRRWTRGPRESCDLGGVQKTQEWYRIVYGMV